ncbi:MAG: hypothetical protein WCD57_10050 [Acidobacteriaceae bacterium]
MSNKIYSGILLVFFSLLCSTGVSGALHGEHSLLNSLFAIVGFFGAGLVACNLYPRHVRTEDAKQSIGNMFAVVLTFWLVTVLSYLVYGIFVYSKTLAVVAVLLLAVTFRWYWKSWWKKFWKSHHDSMGLADLEQVPHWGVEDFTREFEYARQRFELATDENQKKERLLDMFAVHRAAKHYGFALESEATFVGEDRKEVEEPGR